MYRDDLSAFHTRLPPNMQENRFVRHELRTLDLDASRAFYADVLGDDFWQGSGLALSRLPERAVAMGAPQHWLGLVGVRDFDVKADQLTASGAQPLGPRRNDGGVSDAVLRDPFGAVFGITSDTAVAPNDRVAWWLLNVHDETTAFAWYARHFWWAAQERHEQGATTTQNFGWTTSSPTVGSVANSARLPGVHTHWLYGFRVSHLDEAIARVRAAGGKSLPPTRTPAGDLVAVCDDAQGAAFGLCQRT
ncbi:MAG TPA: VOC family protein [Polyangia bacterium]